MLKKKTAKLLSTILGFSVILNVGNKIIPNTNKTKYQLSQIQIVKISFFGSVVLMLIAFVKRFRSMSIMQKAGCIALLLLGGTVMIFGFEPILFLLKSVFKYCVASVGDLFLN